MKKIIFLILFIIVLNINIIFLVNASLGTFQQNDCINIRTILNSSYVNISSLSYPDSTKALTNVGMTKNGYSFNYSFCNTTQIGNYIYDYFDDKGNVYVNDFTISITGYTISTGESIIYFIGLIISIILFGLCLYFTIIIPYENESDSEGFITIKKIKYLKIFMIPICYMFLLMIVGLARGITANLVQVDYISNIFNWIFWLMLVAILPMIPIIFFVFIAKLVQDNMLSNKNKHGGFFR